MSATPTILICDDEADLAGELGEFFRACGWTTFVHTDAVAAFAALKAGLAPTCLLTDLRIGQYNGAELIAQIRALPAAAQPRLFCVMTGHIGESTAPEQFGADLLFIKPIDPDLVLNDIETHLTALVRR